MAWFKRTDKGIQTSTEDKKDTPKGLWYKTPSGKVIDTEELKRNETKLTKEKENLQELTKKGTKLMKEDNITGYLTKKESR